MDIHLAFPDGALAYDCPRCDQRCCKTGHLAVFPREHDRLVRLRPALELVAPPTQSAIGFYATPPSGCWFLEGSRCEQFTAHGGALRPLACTLFPFNLFALHGDTFVVAPNPLCPLEVRPGDGIAFADVVEVLGTVGAAGAPPTPVRLGDPPDALVLERLLRDATRSALSEATPLKLLAFASLASRSFAAGGVGELAMVDLHLVDAEEYEVRARWLEHAEVLGIAAPGDAALAAVAPQVAAWMPSLRLFCFDGIGLGPLARAFEAFALLAAHWAELRPGRPVLPQTLAQLATSLRPICALLALWHEPWAGPRLDHPHIDPGMPPAELVAELPPVGLARQHALWSLASRLEAQP